jgi:hypothetical protein
LVQVRPAFALVRIVPFWPVAMQNVLLGQVMSSRGEASVETTCQLGVGFCKVAIVPFISLNTSWPDCASCDHLPGLESTTV